MNHNDKKFLDKFSCRFCSDIFSAIPNENLYFTFYYFDLY